MLKINDQIGLQ